MQTKTSNKTKMRNLENISAIFSEQEQKQLEAKILESMANKNDDRTQALLHQYRVILLTQTSEATVFPYYFDLAHLFYLATEAIEKHEDFWVEGSFFMEDFWGLSVYDEDCPEDAESEIIFELSPLPWARGENWTATEVVWMGEGSAFRWGITTTLHSKLAKIENGEAISESLAKIISNLSRVEQPSFN